jgi:heat shock protein HslJ
VTVTDQSTGEVVEVPRPEIYTIIFRQDGAFNSQADCNRVNGTYAYEPNNGSFSITLGATTLAFCGEASLDQQFLTLLTSVAAGGPDGQGGWALETAGGAQRMIFRDGGDAPAP